MLLPPQVSQRLIEPCFVLRPCGMWAFGTFGVARGIHICLVRRAGCSSWAGDVLQLRPFEVVAEEWTTLRAQNISTPQVTIWQTLSNPAGNLYQKFVALYRDPACVKRSPFHHSPILEWLTLLQQQLKLVFGLWWSDLLVNLESKTAPN
jgi:hypothetical protein